MHLPLFVSLPLPISSSSSPPSQSSTVCRISQMNQSSWTHLGSSFTLPICLLTLFLLPRKASSAVDPQFVACSNAPKTCGNGTDGLIVIKYPFYIKDLSESYCGYPGFEVACNGNPQPVLKVSGDDDYVIHQINYYNQTLRVSNVAFSASNSTLCASRMHNLTLPAGKFEFGPYTTNATVLFNCSSSDLPRNLSRYEIGACSSRDDSERDSVLAMAGNDSKWVGNASEECGGRVLAPVDLGGGEEAMMARLRSGFVLKWTASNCSVCETSGGKCGFDVDSYHFQCFCPDRPHAKHCVPDKNLGLKLGLGLGVGIIGFIAICLVVCYITKLCYKHKYASKDYISRNISSDPSSTSDLEGGSLCYGVHTFSYTELEEATNNFKEANEIGDGGFGAVYFGKLRDGREVAVKRLYQHNYRRLEQFINEVEILTRLRHKNLVSLYGCTSRRSRDLLLVYEFIPNGTLAHHLHGEGAHTGPMTWPIRMNIALETASALAYLHASDTIHRDVKTDNILLDNNFGVKVADFGLSKLFPNDVTHVSTAPQGTPGYVDPEYHQCYQLTDKSDVYSFGVVLIELVSSMPAVDITRHRHDINLANFALSRIQRRAFEELVDPSLGFDSDEGIRTMIMQVAELAFRCLQQDKEMRPDMKEVVENLVAIEKGGKFEVMEETEESAEADDHDRDDEGAVKSVKPPPSPDCCDEIGLLENEQALPSTEYNEVRLMLKGMRPPPSPVSVTERWVSTRTTPNPST